MDLYKKTINTKNTAGKITSLLLLLCGAALFILANASLVPFPAVSQLCGIVLLTVSIYIASVYLLKQFTFMIVRNEKPDSLSDRELYDFIITEKKGGKDMKVCHLGLCDIESVRVVDPKNRSEVKKARKEMQRFSYNTEFAAGRWLEVIASTDGEQYSIFITYDEELLELFSKLM